MRTPAANPNATLTIKETRTVMLVNLRLVRVLIAATVLAGLLVGMAAAAPRAEAVVSWDADVRWAPTVLQPGAPGGVSIEVGNTGDEQATDFPTVVVTLPPGVTMDAQETGSGWNCVPDGAPQVLTCQNFFGAFFPPLPHTFAGLGAPAWVLLTFNVAADAPTGTQPLSVTLSGGGAGESANFVTDIRVGGPVAEFGVLDGTFTAGAKTAAGQDYTQAGGHPDNAVLSFVTNKKYNDPLAPGNGWAEMIEPVGSIKDMVVDLPTGFVGSGIATPTCRRDEVMAETCAHSAQIGIAETNNVAAPMLQMYPIYNIVPDSDAPAQFMLKSGGGPILITPVLRSDGSWGVSVETRDVTEANPLFALRATIWGDPADPANDDQRCAQPSHIGDVCAGWNAAGVSTTPDNHTPHVSSIPRRALLTNPTRCDGPAPITSMHLSPWQSPARFQPDGDPDLTDPLWESYSATSPPTTGCDALPFTPTIDVKTTSAKPGTTTGFEFKLNLPQNQDPDALATAHLRNATVTLPPGTTVNPGSADGLTSCSSSQIGLVSKSPVRFTKLEPTCPLSSKIGTVTVDTPLIAADLQGDVFLAGQGDHPFDSLAAIYMVVRGPGIVGKIAGEVNMNPQTRILSTTVRDNPEVPFESLTVKLKSGDRAPLSLPSSCGEHEVKSSFTSWAGHSVNVSDDFMVACPGTTNLFNPSFVGGSSNPVAGEDTSMRSRITRDAGKELGRVTMDLPRGLLAGPRDVAVCTDAQLQTGAAKTGRQLQVAPSCPAASQIGTTTVGVGAGVSPFYPLIPGTAATGRIFLTGTHHTTDAPVPGGMRKIAYGAAIEVPAVAGPFDLGRVVVRAAIYADPATADLKVVSDKLPSILTVRSGPAPDAVDGVVLNARDVRVDVDRANFVRNPTSCREQQFGATIAAQDGTTVQRSTRFQVADCASLGFKPRLGLRLTGKRQMKSEKHPGIKASFRLSPDHAGVKRAKVTLPGTLALDSDNARSLCEFVDGIKPDLENHCPAGSIVGRARATSPLLKRPLSGNVYFVKNVRIDPDTGNQIRTLPMIIVALRGEIAVNLKGESDTSANGRLVSTFAAVPDAPVSQFNLNIKGGKNGIILVTETRRGRINICKAGKQIAEVDTDAQSGKRRDFNVKVKTPCKKPKRKKSKRR